jgi:hypothetical protein
MDGTRVVRVLMPACHGVRVQQPADVRQGSEDESAAGDAEAESRVGEVPGADAKVEVAVEAESRAGEVPGADAKVEVVAEPPGGEVPGADVVLEVAVEAESRAGEVPGADAGAIDNWANHQAFLAQTELHPLVESHVLTAHFHAVDLEFHPRWAGNLHLGQVVLLAHSLYHLLLLPVLSLLHSARKSENDLVVQICIIRIGS